MTLDAVVAPPEMEPVFAAMDGPIKAFFNNAKPDVSKGRVDIEGLRYMWAGARGMAISFRNVLEEVYGVKGAEQILYAYGKALGKEECEAFCKKFGLTEPMAKLAAGPVYFAYSGWAHVKLMPPSDPTLDENYLLAYAHESSFEAEAFIAEGKKTDHPICMINAGYSAGWCGASFNLPLEAREITCEAKGDKECIFLMTHRNHLIERAKLFADALASGKTLTPADLRVV